LLVNATKSQVGGDPDAVARLYHDAILWAGLEALEVNLWLIAANQALIAGWHLAPHFLSLEGR
jgi:hypothetical protein